MEELKQETVNELKGLAWNRSITPRLEAISSGLSSSWWVEGLAPYLAYQVHLLQDKLDYGCDNQRDEDKLRGRIIAFKEIISLPEVIENTIKIKESNKKRAKPSEESGY